MKKNYTGLEKTTDSGILAPGGRIQNFWREQGVNVDFNRVIELVEEYNFTGVEFGNWVPQDERLSYVNDVYMGLPVMCDFLKIEKKDVGQNKISLAFGARGRRKSNAHFEPTTYAINLTRKRGRKSFLHEYIHAIDRIMYEATKSKYGTNPQMLFSAYFAFDGEFYLDNSRVFEERLKEFITEDGVRGAFARLFWNLCFYVETKNGKSKVKWSKFYDICKRTGEYYAYPWEILARSMEAYFAHIYLKQEAKTEIRGIAKHTTYFSGQGVNTTIYPKAKLVEEFKSYFNDVLKSFAWVLDAEKIGKPNKQEPKFIPSSSIINEATDLDLKILKIKAEVKKPEVKKVVLKKVEKKKPEVKKPEVKKVAQKSVVKTEENKYSIDNLYEQIKRGYYFNSFNPEKRAKEDINTYNDVLKKKIDELKELGASDSEIDTFFNGFKTRLLSWYSALSRTASSAVTGGSKFPVESNRKKMKSADNKYDEFLNFYNDYVKNYKKKNAEPITPSSELEKAQKKLNQEEKNLEMMKQVNAIIRKFKTEEKIVPELVKLGIKETLAKEFLKPDYAGRTGFPTYSLQNTRQEIARLKQRVIDLSKKIDEGKDEKIKKYATINNGFIQIDFEQDRVQIIFDDKPSADIISSLKRKAFKWSPSNKAWQRKYTQNTIRDVENLFREEIKIIEKKEVKQEEETNSDSNGKMDLIDILSNSMEVYDSPEDFANNWDQYLDKNTLKSIFTMYWEVDAINRLKWDAKDWQGWLYKNFAEFLSKPIPKGFKTSKAETEKIETEKVEINRENNVSGYYANLRSGKYFKDVYDLDISEIIDDLNDEYENKNITWEIIARYLNNSNKVSDKFKSLKNKVEEFAWYCIYASIDFYSHKASKNVENLLRKFKPRNLEVFNENYAVFTLTSVDFNKLFKRPKKDTILDLKGLQYITERFINTNIFKSNMSGVYYDESNNQFVIVDGAKLIELPTYYVEPNVVGRMNKNTVNAIGLKEYKNFSNPASNVPFPAYKDILHDESNLKRIFSIYVKEELEKIKQLKHFSKFSSELAREKNFLKFSEDGGYFSVTYSHYAGVLEALDKLGKREASVFLQKEANKGKANGYYIVSGDIKILLMPQAFDERKYLQSVDTKRYNFETGLTYPYVLPIFTENQSLDELQDKLNKYVQNLIFGKNTLSDEIDNNIQMFDNQTNDSFNIEQQENILLSDEITAPELEVNKKYDLPAIVNNNTEVVTIQQMKKNKIKPMQLPSKYNSLLGKVPNNFRMLLWGAPGHGKSSLALTIGNDIARRCKVLFVSAEESVQSATLQNRIKRFKANSRNLMFNDTTNPAIIESIIAKLNPKFIIIDSVNVIEGKVEAIINLMMKYPEIGFIVIAQATKDHKRYSGLGSLAHAVDIVVNVKSGIAQAEKNRFASLGSMPVKGITI